MAVSGAPYGVLGAPYGGFWLRCVWRFYVRLMATLLASLGCLIACRKSVLGYTVYGDLSPYSVYVWVET